MTEQLEGASVSFCHWKSNEHLLAAVAGDTDLDVLFEISAHSQAQEALARSGFWPCIAAWRRRYPCIEDHLAVDPATGKLVHVHAHFRLYVGEEAVKSFHFSWEREMLDTRQWNSEAGFYAASPSMELLLLMVRSAIKQRHPSLRKRILGSRASGGVDEQREFLWLKERVCLKRLKEVALELLGPRTLPAIEVLYARGLGQSEARLLSEACDAMSRFRRRGPIVTWLSRWARWTLDFWALAVRKLGIRAWSSRRRVAGGGLVVAILGADGSGKSSLVMEIDRVLSRKLDVLCLYLGSGVGASSALRWPLVQLKRLRARLRRSVNSSASAPDENAPAPPKDLLRTIGRILWALSLALERKAKLRKAQKARRAGVIVITDRYPQGQIPGYNDGPLLGFLASSPNALLRKIGAWEDDQYGKDRLQHPDLVIKLTGTSTVLGARRPDMAVGEIARKQEAIAKLEFSSGVRVVRIDADQAPERVVTEAMVAIGTQLAARSGLWKGNVAGPGAAAIPTKQS